MSNQTQNPNNESFCIKSFDIDLAFEFLNLEL